MYSYYLKPKETSIYIQKTTCTTLEFNYEWLTLSLNEAHQKATGNLSLKFQYKI